MTRHEVRQDREAYIREWAKTAFADHVITVEHEHGLYRHYQCGRPDTIRHHFHVVTFPGRLIVCGDVGRMAWERCPDMLQWAEGSIQDAGYFEEKVWRNIETKEWSEDVAAAFVEQRHAEHLEDVAGFTEAEATEHREKHDAIRRELAAAAHDREAFANAFYTSDWYDVDFPSVEDYTHEFLRCREALRWFFEKRKAVAG